MKTLKHTPGEWRIDNSNNIACGLSDIFSNVDHKEKIFTIHHNEEYIEETEYNAKLIAAAPELLESLLKIKKHYPEMWETMATFIKEDAENAINKATK